MSEVNRYEMKITYRGHESWDSLEEDKNGRYVNYENYAAPEAKCAALATESTRLKYAVTQQIELRAKIKKAGRPPHADFWIQSICEAEEKVNRALEETSVTDAFLAEIENKAIRKFINSIEHIMRDKLSPYDTKEILGAMRIFLEEHGGEQ